MRVFDQNHYQALNPSRADIVRELLSKLREQVTLTTAVDVGCGLGYFSGFLSSMGFEVTAIDGRRGNVEEAERRYPQVKFCTMNAEDPALPGLGVFDLVLCFGLLYHLENPFWTVRQLHSLTSAILLVESVIFSGDEPRMELVDEGPSEDQGLNHVAFYPTESCLVKLMYRVGFKNVYTFVKAPEHPDFHANGSRKRLRTMLAASHEGLRSELLRIALEPKNPLLLFKSEKEVPRRRGFRRWLRA